MLRVGRPSPAKLADLARQYRTAAPTYEPVGATLAGEMPVGYVHDDESVVLGHSDATFASARLALQNWAAHEGAGIVVSEGAVIREGETVALAAPLPVGTALAVCRIVRTVNEENRYGFAYGTLPLHPEQGEEAFLIERGDADDVLFRIVAFSKPRFWAARVARPAARALQVRALRNYLRAMQRAVR